MKETQERLNMVIPMEHKVALRKIARTEREAMSVILRRLIRKEAIEKGIWNSEGSILASIERIEQ